MHPFSAGGGASASINPSPISPPATIHSPLPFHFHHHHHHHRHRWLCHSPFPDSRAYSAPLAATRNQPLSSFTSLSHPHVSNLLFHPFQPSLFPSFRHSLSLSLLFSQTSVSHLPSPPSISFSTLPLIRCALSLSLSLSLSLFRSFARRPSVSGRVVPFCCFLSLFPFLST